MGLVWWRWGAVVTAFGEAKAHTFSGTFKLISNHCADDGLQDDGLYRAQFNWHGEDCGVAVVAIRIRSGMSSSSRSSADYGLWG